MIRKPLPIGIIIILVLGMLVTMGFAYAAWTDTLHIDGIVKTGEMDANFLGTFTDDGTYVDDPAFDAGDVACAMPDCVFGAGARDPSGPGPNGPRSDKAIGACASGITGGTLWFDLSNVYPGYYCTVWFDVNNPGSIPWKYAGTQSAFNADAVEIVWASGSPACGDQVDPGEVKKAGLVVKVKDTAAESGSYSGWYKINVVNWNQYDPAMCTP